MLFILNETFCDLPLRQYLASCEGMSQHGKSKVTVRKSTNFTRQHPCGWVLHDLAKCCSRSVRGWTVDIFSAQHIVQILDTLKFQRLYFEQLILSVPLSVIFRHLLNIIVIEDRRLVLLVGGNLIRGINSAGFHYLDTKCQLLATASLFQLATATNTNTNW